MDTARLGYLRIALILVGLIFIFGVFPLMSEFRSQEAECAMRSSLLALRGNLQGCGSTSLGQRLGEILTFEVEQLC